MEIFKSFLIARDVAEALHKAHHRADAAQAQHDIEYAHQELRYLMMRMGYRVERIDDDEMTASPLTMETAAALLGYPRASQ